MPCKHLAAVFYLLAERFDADPFAMLACAAATARRCSPISGSAGPRRGPAPAHGTPLAEVLSEFYAGGPLPTPAAGPDTPSDALLDQVPPFPVEIRGITVSELLRPAYRALGGA